MTGVAGVATFGAMTITSAQDVAVPKDVAAAPADAEKTASGLMSKVLQKGTGAQKPSATDTVTVHYSGWTLDGKMFDSSVKRGKPSSFPLNRVIKGWTEGLQLMVVGEKRRFWIPAELAYGESPGGGRPGGMLCFDVELLSIKGVKAESKPAKVTEKVQVTDAADAPNLPEVPADVAAAPADAVKTESGLASKILTKGTGAEKPVAADKVTVHYSGWDKSGEMFDSSVMRGQPATFPLNGVIKGWTEGLQLMVVGEKRRFWIPADLAYGENPGGGRPGGMLCFDVELLSIDKAPVPPEVPEDVAEAPADAVKTASGLASKVLTKGTESASLSVNDEVSIHYTGWDKSGKMFGSSVMDGEPLTFRLGGVIKGWEEGIQLMVVGEKRRFWVPEALAYSKDLQAQGAPGGDLCFDIELLTIKKAPAVPADVAAAPADAAKTASGLASKVLNKGTGSEKPKATDKVTVHFSGWDKTGKMFNSSIMVGTPATFPLSAVMAGWSEGMQLMVVGEKRRFWIPEALAYDEAQHAQGAPVGPLCLDVELIEFGPAPQMPEVPKNISDIPADAIVSEGEVKSMVLKAGAGELAKDNDVMLVNYTLWDAEGNILDSSVDSGESMPIPLTGQMPPALKSALMLMKPGEIRQFWIPSRHFLGDAPVADAPKGPFCYHFEYVELVEEKK